MTSSAAGCPTSTARPLRLPRNRAKKRSASACVGRSGGVTNTVAAVIVPLVPGVQASASTTSASFTGEVRCTEIFSFAHPG